ncbi:hypothetical protein NA56DRAFT_698540 [Hyaloscypha hepaticicola]|uniref:Mid2 domain-containing protein n=1 Tax=Hyaloscypha hepaticicola TaxID=2082293 RepID=A0A2J6QJB5_9HELO|nr:hypothetical protein NA56DRAFT_698540 [Hyaloscypha hepaticicola]
MLKCLLTTLLTFAYLAKADLTTFITSPAASPAATITGTELIDPLLAVLASLTADIIPTSILTSTLTASASSTNLLSIENSSEAPTFSQSTTSLSALSVLTSSLLAISVPRPTSTSNSTTPATSIFQVTATGETTPITQSSESKNDTSKSRFTLELPLGLALGISLLLAAIIFFLYFRRRNSKLTTREQLTLPTSEEPEPVVSEATHSKSELEGSGMKREFDVGIRTAGGGFDKAELPDSKVICELPS